LIFNSGKLSNLATDYDGTYISFPNISISNSSNATVSNKVATTVAYPYPDYINITSTRGFTVYVDTSQCKKFIVRRGTYDGLTESSIYIRAYDSTGTLLTFDGENHPYIRAATRSPLFGGSYLFLATLYGTYDVTFWVHDDVKKIAVILAGADSPGTKITSFSIYAALTDANYYTPAVWSGVEDVYPGARKASASPTKWAFLYRKGAVIENAAPASGSPLGWVCVNRVDTAMKVAAVGTGSNIDVDDTTGMTAGDIITILLDDGTYHNTTISGVTDGDTLALTDAMPSAAAIDNPVYTVLFAAKANL
jgi:hypothetical protein